MSATALEPLFVAHGRWIFGREEDAGRMYDPAVGLAEEEWATEARGGK